jgi:hypothetical protein
MRAKGGRELTDYGHDLISQVTLLATLIVGKLITGRRLTQTREPVSKPAS